MQPRSSIAAAVRTRPGHPVSLRVAEDVKEAMETAATNEGRSLASWAERALVRVLREEGFLAASLKAKAGRRRR